MQKNKEGMLELKEFNLIGISGKINSGKDTVGLMIQYLTDKSICKETWTFAEWVNERRFLSCNMPYTQSKWEIKKFAGKVKDIVCVLIGCSREDLENSTFKSTVLPKSWNTIRYDVRTIDNVITSTFDEEDANIDLAHYSTFYKGDVFIDPVHESLTPRRLLQLVGTECGRKIIHPDLWVNSLFVDFKSTTKTIDEYDVSQARRKLVSTSTLISKPYWIITDVRFPNEVNSIVERGGMLIRVSRNQEEICNCGIKLSEHNVRHPFVPRVQHTSETALDNYPFTTVIDNNGTMDDLLKKVVNLNLNL